MSHSPKDYLYDVKGPWPQPNQALDLWPIVAHMPKKELRKFQWKIGLRYIMQCIFYSPIALWYAWRNPGLSPLSDEAYTDYLCIRSFSKWMYRARRAQIEKYLPGIDMSHVEEGKVYFISDLYLMRHIPSQDGQFVAPTVALFEQVDVDNDYYRPVAIYIESNPIKGEEEQEQSKVVVYPGDGNAWELAKYYVLHGCAYRIVFSVHSILHFPMDALNAISKTILPKDNLVLKMLLPHLEFSLELDFVVQTTYSSPIKNHQEFPYTGVTGTADEIAMLFMDAHQGVPSHHEAYPPYHFKLDPERESLCEYYRFQKAYFLCFQRFARKALKHLTEEEKKELIPWATYIEPFINKHICTPDHEKYMKDAMKHFPTEYEIFESHEDEPLLVKLMAKLMWDLTIGHAGDHYDFGMMEMSHMPMRLRIPPPASRHIPDFDRKGLRSFWDTFRHRLEWKMFYMPTNVTQLYDTDYGFDTPELKALNKEFLADLKKTEEGLEAKGIRNFMPLKIIARSIQY